MLPAEIRNDILENDGGIVPHLDYEPATFERLRSVVDKALDSFRDLNQWGGKLVRRVGFIHMDARGAKPFKPLRIHYANVVVARVFDWLEKRGIDHGLKVQYAETLPEGDQILSELAAALEQLGTTTNWLGKSKSERKRGRKTIAEANKEQFAEDQKLVDAWNSARKNKEVTSYRDFEKTTGERNVEDRVRRHKERLKRMNVSNQTSRRAPRKSH
jgi:hypothetical protein